MQSCKSVSRWLTKCCFIFLLSWNYFLIRDTYAEPHRHQRCSNRLENALKNIRHRSLHVKSLRLLPDGSPYSVYHSIYTPSNDDTDKTYEQDRANYAKHIKQSSARPLSINTRDPYKDYNQKHQQSISTPRVDVEDLRVKLPQSKSTRWVEVEKCKFSTENSTLDTRLIFPDLTISGKVILQPTGGKCSMILRLRHAGIEFRTIPIGFENFGNEESRRIGSASVRTDSHFAEPGFISVFAHSCQAAPGTTIRQNSKRRFSHVNTGSLPHQGTDVYSSLPEVFIGAQNSHRWGKYNNPYKPTYDIRSENLHNGKTRKHMLDWSNADSASRELIDTEADSFYGKNFRYRRSTLLDLKNIGDTKDQMSFNYDIFNVGNDFEELVESDARAFADVFGTREGGHNGPDEALTKDMEKLFSMGVRGLLTTYMQRALQPAIKETLMENMGYRLSYG